MHEDAPLQHRAGAVGVCKGGLAVLPRLKRAGVEAPEQSSSAARPSEHCAHSHTSAPPFNTFHAPFLGPCSVPALLVLASAASSSHAAAGTALRRCVHRCSASCTPPTMASVSSMEEGDTANYGDVIDALAGDGGE